MTQIREGLITANPKPMMIQMQEDSNLSRDLKPSQELLETLAKARNSNERTVDLVKEAYELAIRDGFHPLQARDFLMAELPFLSESTIRKAIPAEAKDSRKVRTTASGVSQNTEPKEPNIVNITTKAEIKDAEPNEPEEDPQAIEIQFLKEQVAELQDALKKTEQFKPAADFEVKPNLTNATLSEESIFLWLEKRDNGVNCYWYPNYGIELFRNRILTQLKNKGVTTFKRLYFEV